MLFPVTLEVIKWTMGRTGTGNYEMDCVHSESPATDAASSLRWYSEECPEKPLTTVDDKSPFPLFTCKLYVSDI